MAQVGDRFYRIEDGPSQNWMREFTVVKVTPCGVWLSNGFSWRRFVLDGARKRYACPTLEEATESFIRRKKRQLQILRVQTRRVERALFEAGSGVLPAPDGIRFDC